MIKFFFSHIFHNKTRSLSIILSVFFVFLTIVFGIYIYQNTASAIRYYSSLGDNERRLTIASSSNLLNIFNTESSLSESALNQINNDENLEQIQTFRLVGIPVSAKFGFFSFALESDIPVFSVTDAFLTGSKIPVGMSRTMLDLYNTQFAGSANVFPQMREGFLIGQKIEFTFGKSKIFQSSEHIANPITGTITTINNDFPGLGLVLPETIVREKMAEAGYSIGTPYKVVAHIKDLKNRHEIEQKYSQYSLTFEVDKIQEMRDRINLAGSIIFGIGSFIVALFAIFFLFLIGGYFRERKDIFKLISLFGLTSLRSYMISIGEPVFLASVAIISAIIASGIMIPQIHATISAKLDENGILFETIPLSLMHIIMIGALMLVTILIVIGYLDMRTRHKNLYR